MPLSNHGSRRTCTGRREIPEDRAADADFDDGRHPPWRHSAIWKGSITIIGRRPRMTWVTWRDGRWQNQSRIPSRGNMPTGCRRIVDNASSYIESTRLSFCSRMSFQWAPSQPVTASTSIQYLHTPNIRLPTRHLPIDEMWFDIITGPSQWLRVGNYNGQFSYDLTSIIYPVYHRNIIIFHNA